MNFEFSEEQNLLRDQAASFLADKSGLKVARAILDSDTPYDADLWRDVAALGWTATAIPEKFGGLGLGHLELWHQVDLAHVDQLPGDLNIAYVLAVPLR